MSRNHRETRALFGRTSQMDMEEKLLGVLIYLISVLLSNPYRLRQLLRFTFSFYLLYCDNMLCLFLFPQFNFIFRVLMVFIC